MPTVELTVEQIVDAVRQLPKEDRQHVLAELIADAGEIPKGEKALQQFKRLRDDFRMPSRQEQRLSDLLAKGNQGALTKKVQQQLDELLDASHQRTMELAIAVIGSGDRSVLMEVFPQDE